MEHNRERVVAIRSGLTDCPDSVLKRSLAEGQLQNIASAATVSGRGPLWSHVDTKGLSDIVRDFHRRSGTLTPKVSANIDRISDPSVPLIRFAHTPDFLPYTGVLSNIVLCETLSDLTSPRAVPVALIVDVDTVEDMRMRQAVLPLTFPKLSIDVPKKIRRRVAGILPPPSPDQIAKFMEKLEILKDSQRASSGISQLYAHANYAKKHATSFGEFSSMLWSRLLNLDAGLGVVFIHQIASAPFFASAWSLLPMWEKRVAEANNIACSSLKNYGFKPDTRVFSKIRSWKICGFCGKRSIARADDNEMCPCGRNCSIFVPALAADVLADWMIWGFAAGSSYLGSSGHVLVSLKIAEQLGVSSWIDVLWAGNVALSGKDSSESTTMNPVDTSQGRVSIVAELCSETMVSWVTSWKRHLLEQGLNVARPPKDACSK